MIITVNKQLETAKEYLKNKDFHLAIEILNSIDINTVSDILLGDYYLLKSECLLNLGEFEHDYSDKAIDIFKKSSNHNNYAFAKYLKGWQYQSLGKNILSKSTLIEAYATALRAENLILAAKSLSRLAYMLQRAGNIEQAIENIIKCIDIYLESELFDVAEKMKNNLARLYISCGSFNKALVRFKECENNKYSSDKIAFYNLTLSHSIVHAYCGNFDKAFELIEKCQSIPEKYDRLRVIYFEYYGHILLLNGQYKKALTSLQNGFEIAQKLAPESDWSSQIQRLIGDVYLHLNEFDSAKEYTTNSLKISEQIDEKVEVAACYRIFAQIEYQKGNNDKAKEWFQKSIDLFRLISSNYELAVTRYLAASTTLYVNGEKSSILYLAKEYFESENITHYVDKVQKELQKNNGRTSIGFFPSTKFSQTNSKFICPEIIAVNEEMVKILDHTKNIASSEMSVLLTGETGTGKEIMARYIHYHSGRNDNFVAVNSSAFPNEMFESELFGYKKGAFTGAKDDKPGLFEMAEGGTFFLDEIGDINLESQAKLLRVLDQKSYRRLGENKTRELNFRLIAATNRNLEQMIKENLFRPDLYFRLKEIEIKLPPLRDRLSDIPALVEYFLNELGCSSKANGNAKDIGNLCLILTQDDWHGNVRELRSEVRKLLLVSNGDISLMIKNADNIYTTKIIDKQILKREQLLELLEKTDWNQSLLARKLNISEGSIRYWIKKHSISRVTS